MGDTALRARDATEAAQVAAPDPDGAGPRWCRVSVCAPHTQVDLALPADVPVAELLPAVTELVDRRRPVLTGGSADVPGAAQLAPVGRPALDPDRTLADQSVVDGALLLLTDEADAPPPPLFDDVIAAIAEDGRSTRYAWTDVHAVWTGRAVIVLGALAATVTTALTGPGPVQAAVLGLAAVAAAVGAALCARLSGDTGTAIAVGVGAVVAGVGAGWAAVPPSPHGPAAALTAAAACGAATALVVGWSAECGRTVFTAAATVAGVATAAGGAATWWSVPTDRLGAAVSLVALALIAAGPRAALWAARLPLPAVPSREESVSESEELYGGQGQLPDALDTAVGARRAAESLSGVAVAAAVLLAAAAPSTCGVGTGAVSVPGTALAVACALTMLARGRAHHDLVPAAALLIGGAAALITTLVTVAICAPAAAPACAAGIAVTAAAAAAGGVLAPRRGASPVLRRAVELAGYGVVATIVPLALWVFDLYARARGL